MTTERLPLRPQRHSWPARKVGLPKQLHRELRHAGAQFGVEGPPVPPAHRRPRGTGRMHAGRPEEPRRHGARVGGNGRTRGLRNRIRGVVAPGSAAHQSRPRDVGTGPPGREASRRKGVTPSGKALK